MLFIDAIQVILVCFILLMHAHPNHLEKIDLSVRFGYVLIYNLAIELVLVFDDCTHLS